MGVKMETPKPLLPPEYRPPHGVPYRVQPGDNWISVADKHGLPVKTLLNFNYKTTKPEYINYYLKHNVGCTVVSSDGNNYSFRDANPGIIYLPSDFAHVTEPLNPALVTMLVIKQPGFTLKDHPTDPEKLWCKTSFEVSVSFDKSIANVLLLSYRQYIRGRVRFMTSSTPWFAMDSIKVPADRIGEQGISPTQFMEDGRTLRGTVLRYGYREARPYSQPPEVDMYSDPAVTIPPQTGYRYRCMDEPGIEIFKYVQKTPAHSPESLKGISIELDFRGEVIERVDSEWYNIIKTQSWSFANHFEITSRTPLMFKEIPRPA